MSTALWLSEHSWEQRCADCDFHISCTQETDDLWELNDCDEFTHSGEDDDEE
jgi:hypothetical protein